jgi:hypothetical protein
MTAKRSKSHVFSRIIFRLASPPTRPLFQNHSKITTESVEYATSGSSFLLAPATKLPLHRRTFQRLFPFMSIDASSFVFPAQSNFCAKYKPCLYLFVASRPKGARQGQQSELSGRK